MAGYDYFMAPVGTLCLNYPSRMYNDVISSSDYDIIYHKVPQSLVSVVPKETALAYGRIPYYAVWRQCGAVCDKMVHVKAIYDLASKNSKYALKSIVNCSAMVADAIASTWLKEGIRIVPTSDFPYGKNSDALIKHLEATLNISGSSFGRICEGLSEEKIKKMAVMLIMLAKNNLVNII